MTNSLTALPHSPTKSQLVDVVKLGSGPDKGRFAIRIREGGGYYLSQQTFATSEEAVTQFKLHLKLLGIDDKDLKEHKVQ